MKKFLALFGAVSTVLFLCPQAKADSGHIVYDNYMPISTPSAYSSTFSIRADAINWSAATVVVTSYTAPAQTFTDGSASTASFTVASYTGLQNSTQTWTITVSSDYATQGASISGGGYGLGAFNVQNPGQWQTDLVYSTNTACSLAKAINAYNIVIATCNGSTSVVYATAPYFGAVWNNFQINTSTPAALPVVITTTGTNNQSLTINGTTLTQGINFAAQTSNNQTATNIATAWAASAGSQTVSCAAVSNVVTCTTTVNGAGTTYATASSSQTALTLAPYTSSSSVTGASVGSMFGGSNASYSVGSPLITVASATPYGLAQSVVYTTSTAVGITPLVYGSTYYVIPAGANTIELASTSTGAIAGLAITLTSSATAKSGTDSFVLTPSNIVGTPSIQWVASNDNTNWLPYALTPFNIAIPSVSYGTFVATGTVSNFDFGHFDYGYLGLSVTAPTSGAVTIKAKIIGNAP